MLGIGFGEMVVIAIILILVVGPDRMPGLLRNLGRGMRQLRRTSRELRDAAGIDQMLYDDDRPVVRPVASSGADFRLSPLEPIPAAPAAPDEKSAQERPQVPPEGER